jgi:hypothetical protein
MEERVKDTYMLDDGNNDAFVYGCLVMLILPIS